MNSFISLSKDGPTSAWTVTSFTWQLITGSILQHRLIDGLPHRLHMHISYFALPSPTSSRFCYDFFSCNALNRRNLEFNAGLLRRILRAAHDIRSSYRTVNLSSLRTHSNTTNNTQEHFLSSRIPSRCSRSAMTVVQPKGVLSNTSVNNNAHDTSCGHEPSGSTAMMTTSTTRGDDDTDSSLSQLVVNSLEPTRHPVTLITQAAFVVTPAKRSQGGRPATSPRAASPSRSLLTNSQHEGKQQGETHREVEENTRTWPSLVGE